MLDESPTKRYGPKVEGNGIHHNPTHWPSDQQLFYGHVWVALSLVVRHSAWGALALPLRPMLYVRERTSTSIPRWRKWTFRTELQMASSLLAWADTMLQAAGKTVWIAPDGAYAKQFLFEAARTSGVTVVGRLRKHAALFDLQPPKNPGVRRLPRTCGIHRIRSAKRAGQPRGWRSLTCTLYGRNATKTQKIFLATYKPIGGVIRVVLVKEAHGRLAFFCTDTAAAVEQILKAFADRATIEQNFHDQKEVCGTGQQQVRNIWTSVGVFHMNLWLHTSVELWPWHKPQKQQCDRSNSPWADPDQRPSHANRRKALRQKFIQNELREITNQRGVPKKLLSFAHWLASLAA